MFDPQQMLVEEKGLENQIKRIKDLIPSGHLTSYIEEQLTAIVESLEDIKTGIKHENDRILTYRLKNNK